MHTLIFNVLVMMLTLLLISCGTDQEPAEGQTVPGNPPQVEATPKTLETLATRCDLSSYGQLPADFDSSFQVSGVEETKAIDGGVLGFQEMGVGFLAERKFQVYLPGQADTAQYFSNRTYYVGLGDGLEPLKNLPGNPLEEYAQREILNSPPVGDESRLFRDEERLIYVFRSGKFINVLDYPSTITTQQLVVLAEEIDDRVRVCKVMALTSLASVPCQVSSFVANLGVEGNWYQSTGFSMHNQVGQLYFLNSTGDLYLNIEVVFEDYEDEARWDFELARDTDWWSGGPPEEPGWKELPIDTRAVAGTYLYGSVPFTNIRTELRYEIYAYVGQ